MYMRYSRDQLTQDNADLYDIDTKDLMRALLFGYEYAKTPIDKWQRKYADTQRNIKFFAGYREYDAEYIDAKRQSELIAQLDADFELGIITKEDAE